MAAAMAIKKFLEKSRNAVKAKAKKRALLGVIRPVRSVQAHVRRARRAALVSPEYPEPPPNPQPPQVGAHDDGEVKSTKYFGVAVTPGDARGIADIEPWDDGTLRGNQDCRSAHDQGLISLVSQKNTHDKDREAASAAAVTARLERWAATAPARAAARRRREERKRAHRARAPPTTRSSEARLR